MILNLFYLYNDGDSVDPPQKSSNTSCATDSQAVPLQHRYLPLIDSAGELKEQLHISPSVLNSRHGSIAMRWSKLNGHGCGRLNCSSTHLLSALSRSPTVKDGQKRIGQWLQLPCSLVRPSSPIMHSCQRLKEESLTLCRFSPCCAVAEVQRGPYRNPTAWCHRMNPCWPSLTHHFQPQQKKPNLAWQAVLTLWLTATKHQSPLYF